jgi:hypothetical protein
MLSDKLSINIIHTISGKHKKLSDNSPLVQSLIKVSGHSKILINVLLNGTDYDYQIDFLDDLIKLDNVTVISSGSTLKLGSARDYLQSKTKSTFYINVDEDDDINADAVILLADSIDKLDPNRVYMIGFEWMYSTPDGEVHTKINPYIEKDAWIATKYPVSVTSLCGLCSWNYVHNADLYKKLNLVRPDANKYDDCMFYNKLMSAVNYEVDFIPLIIYKYNAIDAYMSKVVDKDKEFHSAIDYMLDRTPVILKKYIDLCK